MLITGIQNDPRVPSFDPTNCTITRYKTSELVGSNFDLGYTSNLMATLVARGEDFTDEVQVMASFKNGRMDALNHPAAASTGKKYMGFLTYVMSIRGKNSLEDLVVNDILSDVNNTMRINASCIQYTGSITYGRYGLNLVADDIPEQYVYLTNAYGWLNVESKRTAFAQNLSYKRLSLNDLFKNMTPQVTAHTEIIIRGRQGRGYIGPQTFRLDNAIIGTPKAITPTASGAKRQYLYDAINAENPDAVLPMAWLLLSFLAEEAIMALYSLSRVMYLHFNA
ncbi:hypothetical protein SPFM14_00134 [Salmonella phage SPFM14]|nr:hypothetical protein SPFM14_00134 [Salmonella phage SPFM14]